jgi:benzylsuccinate CoA-transferase BbsF subunit
MEAPTVFGQVKIADFSTSVVGPSATRLFSDYGATVVKVESMAHVDGLRTSPPYKDGVPGVNRSGYFNNFNAGKYSLSLNMNVPESIEVAKRLILWADIVVESFRPGIMHKWGLSFQELSRSKADLIMISSTMLGQTGPFCGYRGYGQHGAAIAGWMSTMGYSDGEIVPPFGAYTDYIGARYAAMVMIAALEYRRRTGKGIYIDHSQVESSIEFLEPLIIDYGANGRVNLPQGNRSPLASPHNTYRCQGHDRWCVIVARDDHDWRRLAGALGRPELAEDSKFATLAQRKRNEDELDQLIEQWTSRHSPEEVTRMLQQHAVPAAVVASSKDLDRDPQLLHRGHYQPLEHSEIGIHRYEQFGFRLSGTPGGPRSAAPCLGEHNELVLTRFLGYSDEEFVQLLAEGVLE